jgi:MFS family permease
MSLFFSSQGPRLTRALQSKTFSWFLLGQTVSTLGDGAFTTALAIAVYQLTGSSLIMGFFLMAQILPELFFTLFGGVVADRFPRRMIIVCADGARAMIVISIAALSWFHLLQLWHLFVLAVLFGCARSFFTPAYRAITPELVDRDHLASANALISLSVQFGQLLGPILGAGFIGLAGGSASLAFAFDGLTFVVSVCSLLSLRFAPGALYVAMDVEEERSMSLHSMLLDVREGFGTIWGSTWLRWSMLVATFGLVAESGAMAVSLPKMVFAVYGSGPWLLAAIATATGLGAAGGAILVGQVRLRRRGVLGLLGYVLTGLALIVFALPLPRASVVFIVLPAAFLAGFGMSVMYTIWATILYELVPGKMLGRVSSVDLLGSLAFLPLGYVLAGWLSDHLGPASVFLLGGLGMVILDLVPLFLRDIRDLQ